jgi:predicted phosphodiesterase
LAEEEGVKYVLHAGDVLDGYEVYPYQIINLKCWGIDEQLGYFTRNYPNREGLTTYFITGNHEKQFINNGCEIGRLMARERNDCVYLGHQLGKMNIGGLEFEICHYQGSTAYSVSYRSQKYLRERVVVPDFLCLGHMHFKANNTIGKTHAYECGCFQSLNDYAIRKGLRPDVGCWILNIQNDGVLRVRSEEIDF